jgi:hypothetical protein
MILDSTLGLFFIPVLYFFFQTLREKWHARRQEPAKAAELTEISKT